MNNLYGYFVIPFLLVISLVINLGIYPLYLEEPRRAYIALEMIFSGNFIVPTMMGESYFAKPPFFNWVIILFYKLLNSYSEWAVRLPTVISLILLGTFNFLFVKKFFNKTIGFYSSLFFILSGTIYFYFSLLGEIDIFYSLIIYLLIISIIYFHLKNNLAYIYIYSFFFASIGFLTKGFPSVIFLYITLFTVFIFDRQFKRFFSIYHILGIFIFVLTVGGYFYIYNQYHPIQDYINHLWSESAGRTVVENKLQSALIHLIKYPVQSIFALLPFSILVIFMFRKSVFNEIFSNRVLKIIFLVFIFNYLIYWISPGANQRYVYMLYPFFILIYTYFYFNHYKEEKFKTNLVKIFFVFLLALFLIVSLLLPFSKKLSNLPHIWTLSLVFSFVFLFLILMSLKNRKVLLNLVIGIIFFRILFDFVYLPVKATSGNSYKEKVEGLKVANLTKDRNLYYLGKDFLPSGFVFYVEREKRQILFKRQNIKPDNFYIIKEKNLKDDLKKAVVYSFKLKNTTYFLIKP